MKNLGKFGEDKATTYLKRHGFKILKRNWRLGRAGELDIIASKNATIHFIEVKSRNLSSSGFCGIESVDNRKQQKIIWLAEQYFTRNEEKLLNTGITGSSFDIIVVSVNQKSWFKKTKIRYLKAAFESE